MLVGFNFNLTCRLKLYLMTRMKISTVYRCSILQVEWLSYFDFSLYVNCNVTNLDNFSDMELKSFFFFFAALSVPAIEGLGIYS